MRVLPRDAAPMLWIDSPMIAMSERLRVLQRQPRRVSITLSYHVHEALLSRSEEEGRSVSNLCAFLLEEALLRESRQQPLAPPLSEPAPGLSSGLSAGVGPGFAGDCRSLLSRDFRPGAQG